MKAITWGRDSHGLFDYESRHLEKCTMKSSHPLTLRRVNNNVEMYHHRDLPPAVPVSEDPNNPIEVKKLLNVVTDGCKNYLNDDPI